FMRIKQVVGSGSAVLNILDVDRAMGWSPGDLDLYTPLGVAGELVAYLIAAENYRLLPRTKDALPTSGEDEPQEEYTEGGKGAIDVIESATISALHPLAFFWSTLVMNFISADAYCIAYPEHMLAGRGLINPRCYGPDGNINKRTAVCVQKYQDRGYTFGRTPTS
ncbi:hypothetical protein C8Q76DRAFT_597912, partial [Earliella scabrosa]